VIYAGIDVNIITHEKALVAGVEAMGLWLWGMCYAQTHGTDGRLPRVAVLGAFQGKRNIMLAKRLVEARLWVESEEGAWSIWNYEKKNQSSEEIAERMAARREANAERQRRRRSKSFPPPPQSDVTPVTQPVTRDSSDDVTPRHGPITTTTTTTPDLPSVDHARAGGKRDIARDEPLTEARRMRVDARVGTMPVTLDPQDEWDKFVSHHRAAGNLIANVDDAWEKWLIDAVRYADRDRRRESDRKAAAAARPSVFKPPEPAPAPYHRISKPPKPDEPAATPEQAAEARKKIAGMFR